VRESEDGIAVSRPEKSKSSPYSSEVAETAGSANGASFNHSLGHRPRVSEQTKRTSAEGAIQFGLGGHRPPLQLSLAQNGVAN